MFANKFFCLPLPAFTVCRKVPGQLPPKAERRLPVLGQPPSLLLPLRERIPLLQNLPPQPGLQRLDPQVQYVYCLLVHFHNVSILRLANVCLFMSAAMSV